MVRTRSGSFWRRGKFRHLVVIVVNMNVVANVLTGSEFNGRNRVNSSVNKPSWIKTIHCCGSTRRNHASCPDDIRSHHLTLSDSRNDTENPPPRNDSETTSCYLSKPGRVKRFSTSLLDARNVRPPSRSTELDYWSASRTDIVIHFGILVCWKGRQCGANYVERKGRLTLIFLK
jgi:hypothetical protein